MMRKRGSSGRTSRGNADPCRLLRYFERRYDRYEREKQKTGEKNHVGDFFVQIAPPGDPHGCIGKQAGDKKDVDKKPKAFVEKSFLFVSVPSRSIIIRSISACFVASMPMTFGAIASLTFATAFRTPLPP